MDKLAGKKLLILGGKPIGSCEIAEYARQHGIYTIVTDYLPTELSEAKKYADEAWDVSTADVDTLVLKSKEAGVDGVYTGVHEFNIRKMIELCDRLELPCFCSLAQWDTLNNKGEFKRLCEQYGVPTTVAYPCRDLTDEELAAVEFPVICKPVDGSGSRGFSVCYTAEELRAAFPEAVSFSQSGKVLVERFMRYENSVIINYTAVNGEIYFSGISDKQSKKVFEGGAPIMSIQFYPSAFEKNYLEELDDKVKRMFSEFGVKNGVIWIEAFCDEGRFTFNEMGFRFGGSLTYLPVEHLYGTAQLPLQIEYALLGKNEGHAKIGEQRIFDGTYCIFPVHVKPGRIASVIGLEELESLPFTVRVVPVHFKGDTIENWGSAQQVFAYIHFVAENREQANAHIETIKKTLFVLDEDNRNLLFNLYSED